MADKAFSDLTAETALAAADLVAIQTAAGNSRKITAENFAKGLRNVNGFRGALVKKSADQTAANYTGAAFIAWDAESYDTDSIHDNSTNNSRLTVPAGVSYVRLSAAVAIALLSANVFVALVIKKNGLGLFDGRPAQFLEVSSTTPAISVAGPVLAVSPGDYFEVELVVETDTSITITAAQSWFAMEIIG